MNSIMQLNFGVPLPVRGHLSLQAHQHAHIRKVTERSKVIMGSHELYVETPLQRNAVILRYMPVDDSPIASGRCRFQVVFSGARRYCVKVNEFRLSKFAASSW